MIMVWKQQLFATPTKKKNEDNAQRYLWAMCRWSFKEQIIKTTTKGATKKKLREQLNVNGQD